MHLTACMHWNIIRSLYVHYNLYVFTTISMCLLQSLCVYVNLYVFTTISMWLIQSLCVYYYIYGCEPALSYFPPTNQLNMVTSP